MRRLRAFLVAALAATAMWTGGDRPAPAAVASEPSVAFVGDSIGRDAAPEIRANVAATHRMAYFHSVGASHIQYHLPLLRPVVRAPGGPDIVVAELGTGDAFWRHSPRQFESDMRAFLNAVTPHVDCVVWIDQKPGGSVAYPMVNTRARAFNDVVHRVVRDYANATYLHYAAWTERAVPLPRWFLADLLHLTAVGDRELARLVGTAVRGCDPAFTTGPFWDVPDDFWAADAINWAAAEGIVTGFDNDTYRAAIGQFRPPVTRGEALQMVWRLRGSPPASGPQPWSDGRPELRAALRWGAASGVGVGYADGTFRPDQPVRRDALLATLWRAAGRPGPFPPHPWPDGPAGLRLALDWAASNGIVGDVQGAFRPSGTVDRAQVAVWLWNTHLVLDAPPPSPAPSSTVPAPSTTVSGATTVPPPTTVP